MEVGAVKQAFNNEVIQLKRSLNQAKIQTIHKLTRKAKTFTDKKKTPEKLKEKLKRKAESAVNEVLIIKKIKPRDVARFTVTHTGNLQDYLNKPVVDQDKACARLLLHKSLQEKYKVIRDTFSSIPIKDLLMSRQERKKLKREALLDQKAKIDKKKRKVGNAEGEWDVETIKTNQIKNSTKNLSKKINDSDLSGDDEEMESEDEDVNLNDEKADSDSVQYDLDARDDQPDDEDNFEDEGLESDEDDNVVEKVQLDESDAESETKMETDEDSGDDAVEQIENSKSIGKFVKPSPTKVDNKPAKVSKALTFEQLGKNIRKPEIQKSSKPKDIHKNKNLNEKLQSRKFKKESQEQVKETKVVDPFFITSTGENYMSVAEPRQPDEIKEIHKQGNRKERRAAIFGHVHVPKFKPRQDFRQNSSNRQNDQSGFRNKFRQADEGSYNSRGNDFKNRNDAQFRSKNDQFAGRNDKQFVGRINQFKGRNDKGDRNDQFKSKNDNKFTGRNNDIEPKVEKLHPSWEAKKKQSGILPFQGKKIVFDEG